ncbi:integrase family protein [Polaromonas sp. YR568]|uniref:tyrosine-type recombinase/integrase n=1 Tax=Polaromonas sp. YR568 TaxID=1855301 RepID=UPI003137B8CB
MARVSFTAARVANFKCPPEKSQVFMWDATTPGLALRATPAGKPSYVFQGRYLDKTIRLTIGSPHAWNISQAQEKARALQRLIDEGLDPRSLKREAITAAAEKKAAASAKERDDELSALTVGEVWEIYLREGKPKRRDAWKPGYRADLELMASAGGVKKKRGKGLTRQGPLYPLLTLKMNEVGEDTLKDWFDSETLISKYQAARAFMMFKGFLRWCSARKAYRSLIERDAGKAASIVECLPANNRRTDALEVAQLPGWWSAADELSNRSASVYLRALLLTGARREELAALKWADVDFKWRKLTLADKVEMTRVIPLTSYLAEQLSGLSRLNEYVFFSKGKSGRLTDPRASHTMALKRAGIDSMTIHGLRRSFSLLGEAAGAPAGAIAQIMGHKPSGTAENYRPRSLDALRPFSDLIEAFILEKSGVARSDKALPRADIS